MNHIIIHRRLTTAMGRGVRNGILSPGYLYTNRFLRLDTEAGSVARAWKEVGGLLNDATHIEGERLGQKTHGQGGRANRTRKSS